MRENRSRKIGIFDGQSRPKTQDGTRAARGLLKTGGYGAPNPGVGVSTNVAHHGSQELQDVQCLAARGGTVGLSEGSVTVALSD